MNDENDKKSTEAQPRKLLLGKRVLRHFNVRSSIQTGLMNSAEPTASTDDNTSQGVSEFVSIRQRCK